ncbi:methyltransferase family protein [Vibrio methylphosphonaticus]|uniref:methyltransferase family protein n=1 Tax=Vibrio methylphosphonaticus TaxID=2946866 RepID=UPI002029C571|nr:isoprenylcysteine carboxylmethyltransferase family protein [Vibrio methylphosphonaticus]MCL9774862.1 isoprenylcysteine carboxylmethyltransferase family protein [Vibrio methylphosphonaticus]
MRKGLELKIPPVVVFVIFAAVMYGIHAVDSTWLFLYIPLKVVWIGLLVLISGYVGVSGVREFHRSSTTVDPTRPHKASKIVDSGVFSVTRNPMYVALYCLLLAWGIYLEDVLSLLLSVLFIVYMTRFQIRPEEEILEDKFGSEYRAYKAKVRRWI